MSETNEVSLDTTESGVSDEPPKRRGNPLWKKGESGNPGGRPAGSKNKLTLLREAVLANAEEIVLDNWEDLVQATVTLAKAGDSTALKILWDRVVPAKKAVEVTGKDGGEFGVKIVIEALSQLPFQKPALDIEAEIIDDEE